MTYAKQLSEDRLMILRPTLRQIEELPEGEWLTVEDSPKALDRLRGEVYTWLHNKALKSLYRLRRLSPGELRVERLPQGSPRVTTSVQESPGEEFCRDSLLVVDNQREAETLISQAVEAGKLTQREGHIALSEWRRIQG